jgi:hypothetical protein
MLHDVVWPARIVSTQTCILLKLAHLEIQIHTNMSDTAPGHLAFVLSTVVVGPLAARSVVGLCVSKRVSRDVSTYK